MYWVYMVRCEDDSLYTGLTTDVPRRVQAHNREAKGARYTRARRPVTLVWQSEPLPDRSVATRREQQIKALTRQQKLVLVASGEA
jgi:putative endonuclease